MSDWHLTQLFMRFLIKESIQKAWVSQVAGTVVKNLPAIPGGARDTCSIPVSRRSPEGGNGNPLHFSCLKIPMDRRAWWA